MSLGFSLLEVLFVLALASGLLLGLAIAHSREFSTLTVTKRSLDAAAERDWKADDISRSQCAVREGPQQTLHCQNPRETEEQQNRYFFIEETP
ncbi:MAG: hypothetical protein J0M12_02995 [Deltaproteobacteria bacterium]|nr:hypothetical protein [Deltaproteobacteria bacterium]